MQANYVSKSGAVEQMKPLEADLIKKGYVFMPDDGALKKNLEPKRYRRWQVDTENGPVVVMLWIED